MGDRATRTRLSDITFNVLPVRLEGGGKSSRTEFLNSYIQAYIQVYGQEPKVFSLLRDEGFQESVERNAKACACTLLAFFVLFMRAYRSTHLADDRFAPSQLKGPKAADRVKLWQETLRKESASSDDDDTRASLFLVGSSKASAKQVLFDSEILFAEYVVGHKIRHGGPYLRALYANLEPRLAPAWLVTEDSYKHTVLDQHLTKPDKHLSKGLKEVRSNVCSLRGRLLNAKDVARAIFSLRSAIMPRVLEIVLNRHGLTPADLEAKQSVCTNPLDLWESVGRALQHYYCLRFYEGEEKMATRLRQGSAVL